MATKEPVRLRQRKMPTGNTSLYLDIYINGRRRYEYLHLYLVPELTRADKQLNRETLATAEAVRAKRVVEVRNGLYGFRDELERVLFADYYAGLLSQHKEGTASSWLSCWEHIQRYDSAIKQRILTDIDRDWILGFRRYLEKATARKGRKQKPLSQNSKMIYFSKIKACINSAMNEGLITDNPLLGVSGFPHRESERMYLTIDELKALVDTPCRSNVVRSAFLFSCLTGLRYSDVIKITWADVHEQGGNTRLIFRQKKTGGVEYVDLAPDAVELMGERQGQTDNVFRGMFTPAGTNHVLRHWCARAGINKDITFHCGRHTFATLLLSLGTDLYTVSKLLGHRQINTTQIYAKVLDKAKQDAVNNIPRIL